jgi:hypothetical protein
MRNKKLLFILFVVFIILITIIITVSKTSSISQQVETTDETSDETTDETSVSTTDIITTKSFSISDIVGLYRLDKSSLDKNDIKTEFDILDFRIKIFENGDFMASETPISSIMIQGKCKISGDILTLETIDEEGDSIVLNKFKIFENKLIFIDDNSHNYNYVTLRSGNTFFKEQ